MTLARVPGTRGRGIPGHCRGVAEMLGWAADQRRGARLRAGPEQERRRIAHSATRRAPRTMRGVRVATRAGLARSAGPAVALQPDARQRPRNTNLALCGGRHSLWFMSRRAAGALRAAGSRFRYGPISEPRRTPTAAQGGTIATPTVRAMAGVGRLESSPRSGLHFFPMGCIMEKPPGVRGSW